MKTQTKNVIFNVEGENGDFSEVVRRCVVKILLPPFSNHIY